MPTTRAVVAAVSVLLGWLGIATALGAWGTSRIDIVLLVLTLLTLAIAGVSLSLYGRATDGPS